MVKEGKEKYLSEEEMAALIKMKPRSLKNRRCIGKEHPPYIKIGGKILYPESLAHKWLSERIQVGL